MLCVLIAAARRSPDWLSRPATIPPAHPQCLHHPCPGPCRDPAVDPEYGVPEECLSKGRGDMGGAYIVRLPCGPRSKYVNKEQLWPYVREFADRWVCREVCGAGLGGQGRRAACICAARGAGAGRTPVCLLCAQCSLSDLQRLLLSCLHPQPPVPSHLSCRGIQHANATLAAMAESGRRCELYVVHGA